MTNVSALLGPESLYFAGLSAGRPDSIADAERCNRAYRVNEVWQGNRLIYKLVNCSRSGKRNALEWAEEVLEYSAGMPKSAEACVARDFESPFDSIEGAQEYLALLGQALAEARQSTEADLSADMHAQAPRRLEAMRLALYKLEKLEQHLKISHRLLNDLRTLRRLLFEERAQPAGSRSGSDSKR